MDQLGEQPSTIRKRLKILVNLINWSRDEKGFTEHQIKVVKMRWDFRREVLFLNREELVKLIEFKEFNRDNEKHLNYSEEYIVDGLKNKKSVEYTNLEVIRDMLVFGCGIGCRYSDLVKLKIGNRVFTDNIDRTQGYFRYRMTKSQMSKEVNVPINKITFLIFKKYSKNKRSNDFLFPRTNRGNPISNQKFNKHLKRIGFIVGLNRRVSYPRFDLEGKVVDGSDTPVPVHELISSHIMRRTFIREGLNSGISPRILMELSGHTTEKVFKRYYDTLPSEINQEGKRLFSDYLSEEEIEGDIKNEKNEKSTDNLRETNLEEKLEKLKLLYEKGLLPEFIYHQKLNELI